MLGATALATLAGSAAAQFPTSTDTETFDTYSVGLLDGQGNWNGWDGFPTSFASVVNSVSRSAPNSAQLSAGADSVNDSFGVLYETGQWTVETWAFLPTGFVGKSYFITLNSYVDGGPYEWNGQIGFNGDTLRLECDCGTTSPEIRNLVFNQWVDLRLDFDFDNDIVDIYYNTAVENTPIASYPISLGVFGQDNFLDIRLQALDLYPDAVNFPNVTPMHFDDISIKPSAGGPPGVPMCFGDGTGAACGCGNNGAAGEGCANGTGDGGILTGSGTASVGADTLNLAASQVPNQPGVFFQGNQLLANPVTFGDGIRCCGQSIVRIGTYGVTGNAVDTDTGNLIGGVGAPIADHPGNAGLNAGDSRCYQFWYRNPGGTNPCGVDFFNLTNAYLVNWGA